MTQAEVLALGPFDIVEINDQPGQFMVHSNFDGKIKLIRLLDVTNPDSELTLATSCYRGSIARMKIEGESKTLPCAAAT